ncbi:hypothetical protein EDC04DRAFT_2607411 [Pisolithus marmoratus]|nr:hypothetical protein EDC04DRAFT_2607411 [Pisolithus marmoratus]
MKYRSLSQLASTQWSGVELYMTNSHSVAGHGLGFWSIDDGTSAISGFSTDVPRPPNTKSRDNLYDGHIYHDIPNEMDGPHWRVFFYVSGGACGWLGTDSGQFALSITYSNGGMPSNRGRSFGSTEWFGAVNNSTESRLLLKEAGYNRVAVGSQVLHDVVTPTQSRGGEGCIQAWYPKIEGWKLITLLRQLSDKASLFNAPYLHSEDARCLLHLKHT